MRVIILPATHRLRRRRWRAVIGDAMNTTQRILAACRDTGCAVLASKALIELAGAPKGVLAEPLPPLKVRGKAAPLELVALTRAAAKAPAPAI